MPISHTAISSAGSAFRMLRGTPMWLFRLPSVATVRNFRERTAAVRSFVEVFPLDPVRPTTISFRLERHQEASFCRAVSVSSTRMTAQEGSMPGSTRLTTTAAAVREASGANSAQGKEDGMRRQGAAVRADTAGSDPFKGAAD